MNWVDLVVLAVIGLSGLLAFVRGFVREVLSIGAWILAALIASPFGLFPYVQPWAHAQFQDPNTADLVAYGGVFVVALIILWMIAGILGGLVRNSMLGGLDRMLGLFFGLARGAVVVAGFYILVGMAVPAEQWPQPVQQAQSLPSIYRGATWLADQVPAQYRPAVAAPPSGRPTTSALLLQPHPEGLATAPRPVRE